MVIAMSCTSSTFAISIIISSSIVLSHLLTEVTKPNDLLKDRIVQFHLLRDETIDPTSQASCKDLLSISIYIYIYIYTHIFIMYRDCKRMLLNILRM